MKIVETSKFQRLRKRIRADAERNVLKEAILEVGKKPHAGKKLKGEFALLRSYPDTVKGQARRGRNHGDPFIKGPVPDY